MIYAGIDIGSNTAKTALIENDQILGTHITPSGYLHAQTAEECLEAVLEKAGRNRNGIEMIISTGYGRNSIPFADKAMTEIICHAAGVHFLYPHINGIIDVGGQDSKAILLDAAGHVNNFSMNDKCAAGTGRFIEVMADALGLSIDEMGDHSLKASDASQISSICTVFAESEVISMIARQEPRENIIAGIHQAAAARIASLARKINLSDPIMMSGGVARNIGMVKAIEVQLNTGIQVSENAQMMGAIGAAVLASRS